MGKYTCEFAEVKLTSTKKGRCKFCGRTCSMTKKFYQTINPFNKNADGFVKTAKEIMDELIRESVEWKKEDAYHKKCLTTSGCVKEFVEIVEDVVAKKGDLM